MKIIYKICLFFCVYCNATYAKNIHKNSFSPVVITSMQAMVTKNSQQNKFATFVITYEKNVHITLADKCHASADFLQAFFIEKKKTSIPNISSNSITNNAQYQNCEKITIKGSISFFSDEYTFYAQDGIINPKDQSALFTGSVCVEKKTTPPIKTYAEKVLFNLVTKEVTFIGSEKNPVNTTVLLTKKNSKKNITS